MEHRHPKKGKFTISKTFIINFGGNKSIKKGRYKSKKGTSVSEVLALIYCSSGG